MQCDTALCLSCLFVIVCSRRVNYCGSRMCGNTDAHTFCQYPSGPSPQCSGYIEAHLSVEEKSRLLARLNRRRNEAASGKLRTLPSAGNMLKLRWIEELAKEAQLWADQCRPASNPEEQDECRDLYSISVGQCVASVVGEAPGLRIESMVDMWYMQSLHYKGNVTSYVPPDSDRFFYGDFAQMIWARSYMVGCGRSRFMVVWQGRLRSVERLVCNMSPAGPASYRGLWGPAAPATTCPPRSYPDIALTSLCNYQLEMNVSDMDNTMTIEEHVLLASVLELERNVSLFGLGSLDDLYLTNLAIVTLESVDTSTTLYNSIHKRDIVEAIDSENINFNFIREQHDELKKLSSTDHNNKTKSSKKKFSTIGRPKTYNMEELTVIGGDQREDNEEIVDDFTKIISEIYGDYNIVETPEENETTTEVAKIETIDDKENKSTTFSNEIIDDRILASGENVSSPTEITSVNSATELNINMTSASNKTLEEKEKSIEDYLTDPETVRQLQQALDRMEYEQEASKLSAKVRRELPESVESFIQDSTPSQDVANKSIDRGPMLNIVLKYMPYLKQYEGEILGRPNSAICVCPSAFLAVFMFLMFLV